MTLDFLPPQAYTKETLLKAYNWLQGQSEQVREMAGTPDQLVSLYLKAKHHGQEALERPSLQSFKSELKNLAGMMGDLEKKQSPQATVQQPTPSQSTVSQPQYHQPGSTQMTQYQPPAATTNVQYQPAQSAVSTSYQAPVASPAQPATTPTPHVSNQQYQTLANQTAAYQAQSATSEPTPAQKAASSYDEMTMKMIREVKNELNLSSEMEALRMLVKLGYTKAQTLYK